METSAEGLALARDLARHWNAEIPPAELARVIEKAATPAQLTATIQALQEKALQRLDQSPSEACGLARVAHELASAGEDSAVRAESALTFAIALNRLGEFMEARRLAEQATSFFVPRGDQEKAARSLCEAAWADTFVGDLNEAAQKIERARATTAQPLPEARCDWIQARVHRGQANYPAAKELFEKARDAFQIARLPLEAARCERELAHTDILGERGEALSTLKHLRQIFEDARCLLDVVLCDYFLAVGMIETSRYPEALQLLLHVQQEFRNAESGFLSAWCDQMVGVTYRHLGRYDDSLKASHQARNYFLSHGVRSEVSACDINLGNAYYVLNQYVEALALYQEAADPSLTDGREARTALIYTNMGLVYTKQALFSKSLYLHQRALQIATSKNLLMLAATNRADLAACYRQLGQYDEALTHLQGLKELALQHHLREALIQCNITLADIDLARGEIAEALACLEPARSMAVADGLDSFVAVCDRLLAQASAQLADREHALEYIENARILFLKHTQTVDAALCDLIEGDIHLQWNEVQRAQECFIHARLGLSPAFPDQAWRADYGLGRCAIANQDAGGALDYYLHAVRTIATSRSALVTEQISNDFFARRQSVFDEALSVALRQGATETALEVIEASKARTFLTLLQNRDWKQRSDKNDPYVAYLIEREKSLRYQLNGLRGHVIVQSPPEVGESLRGGETLTTISGAAQEELNALSRVYEAVIAQLRLAETGLAGVAVPAPFNLETFRSAANAEFGSDWTALDYYLAEDTLTVVVIGPKSQSVERRTLSAYDRAILDDCATPEPDMRELIYRGTLHGISAPTPRFNYLRHLHHLLIPDGLGTTLIISPHGLLHSLPFHALLAPRGDAFLIEQHPLLYSPNLQALQLLLSESSKGVVRQPLALGVSVFGDQMQPLPSAAAELERVRQAFDGHGVFLYDDQATRRKLRELDASGELREFDVLHFATHVVLDGSAPHQSRVLMSDDALTTTDILDLSLNARLVTLSACQTALGQGGRGDELIGLARAFFYAGVRALLATLWHVEDEVTVELMGRFYCHLAQGENTAAALRNAQVEMIHSGSPLYHWSSFVLIGRP